MLRVRVLCLSVSRVLFNVLCIQISLFKIIYIKVRLKYRRNKDSLCDVSRRNKESLLVSR